jgi:hypothetical protein
VLAFVASTLLPLTVIPLDALTETAVVSRLLMLKVCSLPLFGEPL